jgi:hypothetical protein
MGFLSIWGYIIMQQADFKIWADKHTRLTSNTFNERTRVKRAKKHNSFWNTANSKPSAVIITRPL